MDWPWSPKKVVSMGTIDKLTALCIVTDICKIDKCNIRQSDFHLYDVSDVVQVMIRSGLYKRAYDLETWNCKHLAKSMLYYLIKSGIRDCGLVIGMTSQGIAHEVNWVFTADKKVAFIDGKSCTEISLDDVSAMEM